MSSPPLPLDADLLCHRCRQNLRGVPDGRCPECGAAFDRIHLLGTAVPWETRWQLGLFPAFGATVRRFTSLPRSFRPAPTDVTLTAARRFSLCILTFLLLSIEIPAIIGRAAVAHQPAAPQNLGYAYTLIQDPWFFATTLVSLLLAMFAVNASTAWVAIPRNAAPAHRSYTAALCCYAWAPLAYAPPTAAVAAGALAMEIHYETSPVAFYPWAIVAGVLALLLALLLLLFLWRTVQMIARTSTRRRAIAAAILLPPLWIVIIVTIFITLQLLVNYTALLIGSF